MAAAALTIHRLRLGPGPPRLATQLEDALRTSSKPAALLHRHVLVRRLRLRMPGAASAQGIALQLEQAWLRIGALAQPLDAASDADEVVWAPSEAAARAALVARWARGEAPAAWFWQRIARPAGGVEAGAWPQRALRLMLAPLVADGPHGVAAAQAALSMPAGPAPWSTPALRPVLQALADGGALPWFATALTVAEARQLVAAIEASVQAAAWLLLSRAGLGAAQPARVRPPAPGALVQAWQVLQARLVDGPPRSPGAVLPWPQADPHIGPWPADVGPAPAAAALQLPLRGVDDAARVMPPSATLAATAATAATPAAALDVIDTAWAGLWLLLPVLLRCGLGDDAAPLPAFAQALQAAPAALHIPADDPVRALIDALDLPRSAAPGPWLRRARLAAVHDARLPLRRIALRQGTVHLSDLRLDVVFPVRAADVRIRRAGFDLDPGFVPWLGRSVHVHYV